jgi:hypothetical protein
MIRNVHITITDDGKVVFFGPINGSEIVRNYGWHGFQSTLSSDPTLCVVRFSGSTRPVVLLDQFVYGIGNYNGIESFGQVSDVPVKASIIGTIFRFKIITYHGHPIIETVNANWDIAGPGFDGMPIGLLSVKGEHLANVTRKYPSLVLQDAARNWNMFVGSSSAGRVHDLGSVTAWAGDECEIGREATALATLHRLEIDGMLTTSVGGPRGSGLLLAIQERCKKRLLADWPLRSGSEFH